MDNFRPDAQLSLVLFTLFTQAAVGAFWVLLVNDFLKRRVPDQVYDGFTRIGTYILIPLTALGLLFSTTHLGRPQYAFRALQHIGTSWLSREVWAFSLFFVLVAVYTYLWYRRSRDAELRRLIGAGTGLVGLLALWAQSMVYQVPGRPMWNHSSTSLLFFASAFLLGPLLVAVVYNFAWGRLVPLDAGEAVVRLAHRRLGLTLLVVDLAYAVSLTWRLRFLNLAAVAAADIPGAAGLAATGHATHTAGIAVGAALTRATYGGMMAWQIGLSLVLPTVLAVLLWYLHRRGASLRLAGATIALALVLVAAGEMLGRALFYLSGSPWF